MQNENEKIIKKVSVIVPIYNVQAYIEKCLESIMGQTYKELEIILVNDGSTDSSPQLCEQLANRDHRIKVVHKTNGGLSDARNAGLEIATGDYIGFVDGDDYIDVDMFQILVENLEKHNADIASCRYARVWEDGKKETVGNTGEVKIYNGLEPLREYIYGKNIDPFVCNKLYRSYLINGERPLRFIKGIIGEDNPFLTEMLKRECTIVSIGESKYNYLQKREGAITSAKISQKRVDAVYWWDTLRRECVQEYPEFTKYALRRQTLFYIGLYNEACLSKEYIHEAHHVQKFVKEHAREIIKSDVCEKTVKIAVFLLAHTPGIYQGVMRCYKKIIGQARL